VGCTASGSHQIEQERTVTTISEAIIEHQDIPKFIINTHAFHNAHLLRKVLPRDLTRPLPLLEGEERQKFHFEMADRLREVTDRKRKEHNEKAAAKKREAAEAEATAKRLAGEAAALESEDLRKKVLQRAEDVHDDIIFYNLHITQG
jgi:hypothetical protein